MTHGDHRNPDDFEAQVDLDLPDSFGKMLNFLIDHGFEGAVVDEWHPFAVSFDLRGLDFAEPGEAAHAADLEGLAHCGQSESSRESECSTRA